MSDANDSEFPWAALLLPCFGMTDRRFGGHPLDRRNTRTLLGRMLAEGHGLNDLDAEVRKYLEAEGCNEHHIKTQIQAARDLSHYLED